VRVTQGLSRLLQQRNGDGYVFRVDLRAAAGSGIDAGGSAISTEGGAALLRAGKGAPGEARPP